MAHCGVPAQFLPKVTFRKQAVPEPDSHTVFIKVQGIIIAKPLGSAELFIPNIFLVMPQDSGQVAARRKEEEEAQLQCSHKSL